MAAKQNITVAIEAAMLKRARAIAARRGRSVSALLADELCEFIVLPLSALPRRVTFSPLGTSTNLLSHMFFIGLPIALVTRSSLKAAPAS